MWRFLKNLEIELPYDPAIPLLGIHTEDTRIERDTCTPPNVHRSTIYNSQDMKQPRCPLADKWIRKLWYIYTMEYYSAIKKNTFESVLMMEKEMATHSSVLAWRTPGTGEPGGLPSIGSHRVGHD